MDRTYWHVPGARSWHASYYHRCDVGEKGIAWGLACGRWVNLPRDAGVQCSDRLPPTAHLCGNCSRIIAARTDIEGSTTSTSPTTDRVSDVPEPVASEQDDWSPV